MRGPASCAGQTGGHFAVEDHVHLVAICGDPAFNPSRRRQAQACHGIHGRQRAGRGEADARTGWSCPTVGLGWRADQPRRAS